MDKPKHVNTRQDEVAEVVANDDDTLRPAEKRRFRSGYWERQFIALSMRISKKLVRRGWNDSALALLQQLVEFVPDAIVVRIWTARVAVSLGNDVVAAKLIRPAAVDRLPGAKLHYCRVAAIYLALEDFPAAERYFQLARDAFPESAIAWRGFAELFRLQGNVDAAVRSYRQCGVLESTKSLKLRAIQNIATCLGDAGRKDAEGAFLEILDVDQNNTFAYYGIVDCRQYFELSDPIVRTIIRLVEDPLLSVLKKSHLHYALGIIYRNSGNPGAAFAHWAIANQILASTSPPFDMKKRKASADARCHVFNREMIDELSQHGCQEQVLVCVVGMPRSGTTLTPLNALKQLN